MSSLLQVIEILQNELTEMLLKGYSTSDPEVIRKSQELDKLVTAYYKYEYSNNQSLSKPKKVK